MISKSFAIFLYLAALSLSNSRSSNGASICSSSHQRVGGRQFWIQNDTFCKDALPFRIIGGDVHYFRIVPEYWKDRLLRAKALGLNTIQTYVPWNIHEPSPKEYLFEGSTDLEAYIKLAQELGFLVMLRVGPYVCGEWDLGGFPAWLLSIEPALKLRSSDSTYLSLVERWWGILLPKVVPLLYQNGGPVIMVQAKNEYGSFGSDKNYLKFLANLAKNHLGHQTLLYTTDGAGDSTLRSGAISEEGVYAAIDFDTWANSSSAFEIQKKYNLPGNSPPLSTEFYTGWLTHWRENLSTTDAFSTANYLDKILSQNASVVLYMAHGGTNFGFFSGANTDSDNESVYKPDLTSYDYDAPIKEYGDVSNQKYKEIRRVISKYSKTTLPAFPSEILREKYGRVKLSKITNLFNSLDLFSDSSKVVHNENPLPMELVGQMFGFLLYVSEFQEKEGHNTLSIPKVHDRAQVFISCKAFGKNMNNQKYVGVIERWANNAPLNIPNLGCSSNITLSILVENMGRVNYGPYIYDRKGILSAVQLNGFTLHQWKMYPISFDQLVNFSKYSFIKLKYHHKEDESKTPALYRASFIINSTNTIKDTFISFRGLNKGVAFVNNFNIGRFWPVAGPQCTLYVPAPILKQGENILVIFELESVNNELTVDFVTNPDFTCGSTNMAI
ncbi:hypothetical protein LUZ60_011553 [Juncus effusus]|nr:hypothetical protein LUZ60_011553 [Juncus effusus]